MVRAGGTKAVVVAPIESVEVVIILVGVIIDFIVIVHTNSIHSNLLLGDLPAG